MGMLRSNVDLNTRLKWSTLHTSRIIYSICTFRKLKGEIENKRRFIENDESELDNLQRQYQYSVDSGKKTQHEIHNINLKVAETRRRIQELQIIAEMETPSLQVQMEELSSIEAEIAELDGRKKVRYK